MQNDYSASSMDTDASSNEQDNAYLEILKQLKKVNQRLNVVEEQVSGTSKAQVGERQTRKELSELSSKSSKNVIKHSKKQKK